jgi:hypothetical protein
VHKVLKSLRLETPRSTIGLLLAIRWERLRLAWRGLEWTPGRLEDIPFAQRFDGLLCGELSIELQPYDPLRAALFQARSLRMALHIGVPHLVARALCAAATVVSVPGTRRGVERSAALLDRASEIEANDPNTLVRSNISSARAVCAMLQGRMEESIVHAEDAERMFREVNASDEGITRTRARLHWMAGEIAAARQALEESTRAFEKLESREDAARSRWAWSVVSGKEAGAADRVKALQTLREFGHVDPMRDLNAYFPELVSIVIAATETKT